MPIPPKSVVRLDYTLRVDGKVRDTSLEAVAREHKVSPQRRAFQPLVFLTGLGQIIPGLEAHISEHGVKGTTHKVTIPAADAYGLREASRIQVVPKSKFGKAEPKVGMQVGVNGVNGIVTRVGGGRVTIDCNHDLAGKDLEYEYTVVDVASTEAEAIVALVHGLLKVPVEVEVSETAITVPVPAHVMMGHQAMEIKLGLAHQVHQVSQKDLRFVETVPFPRPPPVPPTPEQSPAEGPASVPAQEAAPVV